MLKISTGVVMLAILALVSCGPAYVQPVAQYDPGYNPSNAVADAILAAAIINGVTGYYGPGHVFYPQTMYGGVPGYYVGGVFHTSVQNRTVIVNNYNHDRVSPPSQRKVPSYSSGAGSSGRGASQSSGVSGRGAGQSTPSRPSYGGGSSSSRSAPASRPSYSSGGGSSRRR